MTNTKITKRSVDQLKCPTGKDREFLWDDTLSGFGAAAYASGKKAYVVQYRQNGRSHRLTIGLHGRLTPDEARSLAKQILGKVEGGADPIEQRRTARGARTFKEVSDEFLRLHVFPKRKPRTYEEYERQLKQHLVPKLGGFRFVDIRKVDIARIHAQLSTTPGAANRVVSLFSSIWNWAAKRDEVVADKNPAKTLERYPEKAKERYLSTAEFARLGAALRLAETSGIPWNISASGQKARHIPRTQRQTAIDPHAVAAIRLLILTGARLREILHAQWDQVDLERGLLLLPDSKTGKKTIYLSAAALGVLSNLPRHASNPFIIPGFGSPKAKNGKGEPAKPRSDLKNPWTAISRHAKLPGVRLHDLRHSFGAMGAGSSYGLPMIGKLLGHRQPTTTARYAHLAADPMHRAANAIGDKLKTALDGNIQEGYFQKVSPG